MNRGKAATLQHIFPTIVSIIHMTIHRDLLGKEDKSFQRGIHDSLTLEGAMLSGGLGIKQKLNPSCVVSHHVLGHETYT